MRRKKEVSDLLLLGYLQHQCYPKIFGVPTTQAAGCGGSFLGTRCPRLLLGNRSVSYHIKPTKEKRRVRERGANKKRDKNKRENMYARLS